MPFWGGASRGARGLSPLPEGRVRRFSPPRRGVSEGGAFTSGRGGVEGKFGVRATRRQRGSLNPDLVSGRNRRVWDRDREKSRHPARSEWFLSRPPAWRTWQLVSCSGAPGSGAGRRLLASRGRPSRALPGLQCPGHTQDSSQAVPRSVQGKPCSFPLWRLEMEKNYSESPQWIHRVCGRQNAGVHVSSVPLPLYSPRGVSE